MLGACIDIGSNTTRLLVAECTGDGLRVVHEHRVFTRIGLDIAGTGTISAAKRDEVARVVAAQYLSARGHGAQRVRAVATAAIRNARNGPELVEAIGHACGLRAEIISGAEEARLAFVGAAGMLADPPAGALGVVDVGGGSSELVVGDPPRAVRWWTSVELGSSIMGARELDGPPPTEAELERAAATAESALAQLMPPPVRRVVAVGGSATSLGQITGPRLDEQSLGRALAELRSAPAGVIAQRHGIAPERATLLPAGLVVLRAVARRMGGAIAVGRGGIREGVLLEAAA